MNKPNYYTPSFDSPKIKNSTPDRCHDRDACGIAPRQTWHRVSVFFFFSINIFSRLQKKISHLSLMTLPFSQRAGARSSYSTKYGRDGTALHVADGTRNHSDSQPI